MKRKEILFCCFSALMLILNGCEYDKKELPQPTPEPEPIPEDSTFIKCDTTGSVTYNNFVKTILETNCTAFSNCHGSDAPPGFDYTTYAGIKAKVDAGSFQLRVLELKEMPQDNSPGPDTLDFCTLFKLRQWVNNGAPE